VITLFSTSPGKAQNRNSEILFAGGHFYIAVVDLCVEIGRDLRMLLARRIELGGVVNFEVDFAAGPTRDLEVIVNSRLRAANLPKVISTLWTTRCRDRHVDVSERREKSFFRGGLHADQMNGLERLVRW
jgi:hypothetical protein